MRLKLTFMIIISMLIFNPTTQQISADDRDVPYAYLYYSDLSGITPDGVIGPNEYPSSTELLDLAGDFVTKIWWAHDDTTLAIAMEIDGTGWIGLGLGEVGATMTGGNLIMVSYDGNNVIIKDMFANGLTDPIIDTDEITFGLTGGSEINGRTIIEFSMPLQSNDQEGHDQFWHSGGRFGFFTAYHRTGKDFDREHSKHSESVTVEILDQSFAPPIPADFQFSIIDNNDGTITLHSQFFGGPLSDDHEIGYFQKTLFGNVFIGDVFTTPDGIGAMELVIEKTGELEFVSVLYGDIKHVRQELVATLTIEEVVPVDEDQEYGDLRDTLGGHFMRNGLIFMLFFFVSWLLYLFSSTIYDIFRIYKIGSKLNANKQEAAK